MTDMTITTIREAGIPVSVGDGEAITLGILTTHGIHGIGILGTTPDTIHGIAAHIGVDTTADGMEVGIRAGTEVGLADGTIHGIQDHRLVTITAMDATVPEDTETLLTEDTLRQEITEDILAEEQLRTTADTAAVELLQMDVTIVAM